MRVPEMQCKKEKKQKAKNWLPSCLWLVTDYLFSFACILGQPRGSYMVASFTIFVTSSTSIYMAKADHFLPFFLSFFLFFPYTRYQYSRRSARLYWYECIGQAGWSICGA
ncbi:hypothetical protein GQ42DRAFT_63502 [Ramicandelaber brevisporus]|nr:hypothetical protein GQ42DRAFT_63502 [Ramicandelaber brevisporus]